MNERNTLIAQLLLMQFVLPIGLCIATFFVTTDYYVLFSISCSILLLVMLTGYWEFFSRSFKKVYFLSLCFIHIVLLTHKLSTCNHIPPDFQLITLLCFVQGYVVMALGRVAAVRLYNEKAAVEISFPFTTGMYLLTDAGDSALSRLMNYHMHSRVHRRNGTSRSQRFAADVVHIGRSKKKFFPPENEDYLIFSEKVFAPIAGTVLSVENNIPDNQPYCGGYPYNVGNNVVIRDGNRYLLLGHLLQGSVVVKPGDVVSAGDYIANAGNSGFSERPHLHMQMSECTDGNFWKGEGVPLTFRGRNLYKNRIVEMPAALH